MADPARAEPATGRERLAVGMVASSADVDGLCDIYSPA